jgi:hypothetical protein
MVRMLNVRREGDEKMVGYNSQAPLFRTASRILPSRLPWALEIQMVYDKIYQVAQWLIVTASSSEAS